MATIEITAQERRRQTKGNVYRCLYNAKGFCSKQTLAQTLEQRREKSAEEEA